MKNLCGVLLSVLAAAAVLCSCNVPEPVPTATSTPDYTATPVPPTATPTPTPTATATPRPAYLDVDPGSLQDTELILRCSLDGKAPEKLIELAERFSEENSEGISVKVLPAYSADELSADLAEDSRERTDLLIADSAWLRAQTQNGYTPLDLSDFLNDPDLALAAEDTDPIMPVMLAPEDQSGHFYALPLWTEPAFLYYNKTWALELGFEDTPKDLAAFAEQACAAGRANYAEKDESKHGTGGWIISSAPNGVMSWLLSFSHGEQTPGEILRSDSGDTFSDTAAWLRNLYDNGCAWNSRVKEPYDYFANRYALFYSGTYSDAERQLNAFALSKQNGFDNWDLIFYPSRTAGEDAVPRIYAGCVSIAIPRGEAKNENAAWRFIRWLYSGENAAELALAAGGWPVRDSEAVTKLYRGSGKDKLYQTLSYRQYMVNSDADENWLTDQRILSDGFAYIFNLSAKAEDIAGIWDQIGSSIAEISTVNSSPESGQSGEITETGGNNETEP